MFGHEKRRVSKGCMYIHLKYFNYQDFCTWHKRLERYINSKRYNGIMCVILNVFSTFIIFVCIGSRNRIVNLFKVFVPEHPSWIPDADCALTTGSILLVGSHIIFCSTQNKWLNNGFFQNFSSNYDVLFMILNY